jgi:hypothetical protein
MQLKRRDDRRLTIPHTFSEKCDRLHRQTNPHDHKPNAIRLISKTRVGRGAELEIRKSLGELRAGSQVESES